jgi:NAD(P)-dependent dehydrogenase (short-subunit alcohol dehydrogenase family)
MDASRHPDQTGKTALVTGADSGIGLCTAVELVRAGARVVVAVRDQTKGKHAIRRLRTEVPYADVHVGLLDLADLSSVHRFAAQILDNQLSPDLLVNNAAVMGVPQRRTTEDGFELQFGTNHLGHVALTGLLLPGLLARPGARVVTVSSLAHQQGRIRFDDLQASTAMDPGPPTRSPSWPTSCSRLNSTARPSPGGCTSSVWRYTRAWWPPISNRPARILADSAPSRADGCFSCT